MTSPSHSSTTNELKEELVEIRINPEYQNLVPPMTKEAFESLVSSIRANGQLEAITVNYKGEVLDGHHRLKACELLQLKADEWASLSYSPNCS